MARWTSSVLLFLLCFASALHAEYAAGVLAPLSLPAGKQILAGARLGTQLVNSSGSPVQFVLKAADTGGVPAKNFPLVEALVESGVCGIILENGEDAVFQAAAAAAMQSVPVITASPSETLSEGNRYLFQNSLRDKDALAATLATLKKRYGWDSYVLVAPQDAERNFVIADALRTITQKLEIEVIATEMYPAGGSDFAETVARVAPFKVNALLFAGNAPDAVVLLKQLRKQGVKTPLVGTEQLGSKAFREAASYLAVGTVYYQEFSQVSPLGSVQQFVEQAQSAKVTPDLVAATAYDAVLLLAAAVQKSGVAGCSTAAEREEVREALTGLDAVNGACGETAIDGDGRAVKKPVIVQYTDSSPYIQILQ